MRPRRWNRFWAWFFKLHGALFRLSRGVLGRQVYGVPVLMLTHRGARTGKLRRTPLYFCEDGSNLAVIASKVGEPENPVWFRNLMAHPIVEVQVGRDRRPVQARLADEAERTRIWARMVALYPQYEAYQRRTARRIPVVILEPGAATSYC